MINMIMQHKSGTSTSDDGRGIVSVVCRPPRPRRSVRQAVTGAPSRPSPHTHITALAVTTKTNRFLTHEAGCHNTTFHDRNSIKILKLIKSGMSCFSYVKCRYIQRYKFPYLHIYMIVHFLSRPQHCSDYCSF